MGRVIPFIMAFGTRTKEEIIMPDCSELKEAYEKAKLKAEMSRTKADQAKDRYEDSEDDYNFESGRECSLHIIILPDGTAAADTEAQAECLRERARAMDRYRDKKDRNEARWNRSDRDASFDEDAADTARIKWCACEEKNRHGEEGGEGEGEGEPELELGDWNGGAWDEYVA
jgi:hypothetical protein